MTPPTVAGHRETWADIPQQLLVTRRQGVMSLIIAGHQEARGNVPNSQRSPGGTG